jgi:hypothetical protein
VGSIPLKAPMFQYHTKTPKHLFATLITATNVIENSNRVNYIDQVVTGDDLLSC